MKAAPLYTLFFHLLFLSTVFGQDFTDDSNWYKEIGRGDDYYSRFDFRRYSENDIRLAKAKYRRIAEETLSHEWSGSYTRETMLGSAELTWSRSGYVYTYVYHTLANIDYGKVIDNGDSITLVSERYPSGKPNDFLGSKLVRVRFGERRLLVAKGDLRDFAAYAAGLDVPSKPTDKERFTEEGYVWQKVGDEGKPVADMPTYPSAYARLVRNPIRARVISIGALKVKRETPTTAGEHSRMLALSTGYKYGVSAGMTFWIDDLEERVEIVSVGPYRSTARLSRPIIDGNEHCDRYEDGDQIKFPCREPRIGMNARTKPDFF